jgi:hypothetical protein
MRCSWGLAEVTTRFSGRQQARRWWPRGDWGAAVCRSSIRARSTGGVARRNSTSSSSDCCRDLGERKERGGINRRLQLALGVRVCGGRARDRTAAAAGVSESVSGEEKELTSGPRLSLSETRRRDTVSGTGACWAWASYLAWAG